MLLFHFIAVVSYSCARRACTVTWPSLVSMRRRANAGRLTEWLVTEQTERHGISPDWRATRDSPQHDSGSLAGVSCLSVSSPQCLVTSGPMFEFLHAGWRRNYSAMVSSHSSWEGIKTEILCGGVIWVCERNILASLFILNMQIRHFHCWFEHVCSWALDENSSHLWFLCSKLAGNTGSQAWTRFTTVTLCAKTREASL